MSLLKEISTRRWRYVSTSEFKMNRVRMHDRLCVLQDAKKAHAESVLATEEELQAAKKEMFLRKQEVT